MKFTNKKRGFTIVELIIVIAVIAVLAAVLIPVFSGLIQQGKDAEAKVVVNTLNKGLAMTTTKPATMQDALEAVETNVGINVAKLDETYAKTGNKILWDSEYNTFLFVTKDGEKVSAPNVDKFTNNEINLWAVAKTTDDLKDNYSHYWYGGDVAAVEVATGFDVGVASINAITYKTDATQSVVIRTNSEKTELTINAKNSDVQHYDVAGNVKVLAVKGASYHEHGNVIGTVTVESGHVQIESGAEVASIIASKSASETVAASVTAASGATVGTVVVNHASASVEVKGGATVAEVAPGKDVTIDTSKVTGITPSTTVIDTEKASAFAGGLGTEASPYLIANANQWEEFRKNEFASGKLYWRVTDDLDLSSLSSAFVEKFNGSIDFGNHSLKGLTPSNLRYDSFIFAYVMDASISNLNAYDAALIYEVNYDGEKSYPEAVTKLTNVNMYGSLYVSDNNTTPYIFDVDSGKVQFTDCDNYMTVTNTGNACAGLYVGTVWHKAQEIKFVDCDNYGTLIHSAGYSSMLVSNGASGATSTGKNNDGKAFADILDVSNCHNYGTIIGVTGVGLVNGHKNYSDIRYSGLIDAGTCVTRKPIALNEYNGKLNLQNVSGATKYQITYTFWENAKDNNGENVSWGSVGYVFNTTDLTSISLNTYKFVNRMDGMQAETIVIADSTLSVVTIEGTKYYVFNPNGDNYDGFEYKISTQPFVSVFAYDADGRILDVSVYQYADTSVK